MIGSIGLTLPHAVAATSLPDAVLQGNCIGGGNVPQQDLSASGSCSQAATLAHGETGQGQVTISTQPLPSASATATFNTPQNNNAIGGGAHGLGSLTYSFEIIGPSGTVPVLVNATGHVSSSPTAAGVLIGSGAFALFSVEEPAVGGLILQQASIDLRAKLFGISTASSNVGGTDATGFSGGFTVADLITMKTNTTYSVRLSVNAVSGSGAGLGGGFQQTSALVDPMFQIGPGVPDPQIYSLVFSNGIGNSQVPVPIPAAIWLFISALGGLARARRDCTCGSPDDA